MRDVFVAALVALIVSLVGTPFAIRSFTRHGYGQLIRDDGPTSHHTKRGTPTMGGTVIIAATVLGYLAAHLVFLNGPTASGLLVLLLMTGLGFVGFVDDFIKIRKQRSLGLTKLAKFAGQAVIALVFGILATHFVNHHSLAPASTHLSFTRDYGWAFGTIGFVIWAYVMVTATSNGVNLTDGLDGLASGASCMVFGAYVVIAFWEYGNNCANVTTNSCYAVRDPLDAAVIAAAAMGACFGFLWWNASPARIFMGDTGSLAIGGLLAGLAITTRTELLLLILGGLFVIETLSVIIQVASFRGFGRRVFNMAPFHHHFELAGWSENTVIVRFWIIAGLAVAFGLGVFYAAFLNFK
ncbi:MAG TPA: phospho-N-acetylmuramoyl-pentapeptide-transferase [Mycobacteriales bacterium]|jgi:phospho-N-acetylmuramoyl-pentapeptide-transferase|nr:phospho-N-acetylmuramoyl-pentapeptide-transferase [Mycobacteriales bacterium]